MNIEAERFNIEMTHNELWSTAHDVRAALMEVIKSHWVNNQQSWQVNERERLNRCRSMFKHLGRIDLYDDIFLTADDVFKKHNEKNNQ